MIVHVIVASKYGATREIAEADAVVLGSAVYPGHWIKEAMSVLDEHAARLGERPTWLFSSGPVGDPPKPEDAEPVGIADAAEAIGAAATRSSPAGSTAGPSASLSG